MAAAVAVWAGTLVVAARAAAAGKGGCICPAPPRCLPREGHQPGAQGPTHESAILAPVFMEPLRGPNDGQGHGGQGRRQQADRELMPGVLPDAPGRAPGASIQDGPGVVFRIRLKPWTPLPTRILESWRAGDPRGHLAQPPVLSFPPHSMGSRSL